MLSLNLSLLFLWWNVIPVWMQSSNSTCEVYYILQPIEEFTCNPFTEIYGLRLECVVYQPKDVNYEVHWYRIQNPQHNNSAEVVNQFNTQTAFFSNSQLMRSRFRISSISENDAGVYWCQIVFSGDVNDTGTLSKTSFSSSQKTILRRPEEYEMFPPCSNDYLSVQVSTCATNGQDVPTRPPCIVSQTTIDVDLSPFTTAASNNDNKAMNSGQTIPLWGYGVIGGGGLAAIIIVMCTICMMVVLCLRVQDQRKYHESLLPEKSSTQIPEHLSVRRVASSATEYAEIPMITQATSTLLQKSGPTATESSSNTATQTDSNTSVVKHDHEYQIIDPDSKDDHVAYSVPESHVK